MSPHIAVLFSRRLAGQPTTALHGRANKEGFLPEERDHPGSRERLPDELSEADRRHGRC